MYRDAKKIIFLSSYHLHFSLKRCCCRYLFGIWQTLGFLTRNIIFCVQVAHKHTDSLITFSCPCLQHFRTHLYNQFAWFEQFILCVWYHQPLFNTVWAIYVEMLKYHKGCDEESNHFHLYIPHPCSNSQCPHSPRHCYLHSVLSTTGTPPTVQEYTHSGQPLISLPMTIGCNSSCSTVVHCL